MMAAMARTESPRARPSAISSRCANVKHRPLRFRPRRGRTPPRRSQPAAALLAIAAGRDRGIVDELTSRHASPEHLIDLRNHPIREPHHNTLRTRDVAITARTRASPNEAHVLTAAVTATRREHDGPLSTTPSGSRRTQTPTHPPGGSARTYEKVGPTKLALVTSTGPATARTLQDDQEQRGAARPHNLKKRR